MARVVEYLTVRRFDELDRTPEVIAAHLQDAMRLLWTVALARAFAMSLTETRVRW